MWMIPHLAWSVISTVKTIFIIWETRDWSWKPENFSTKLLAETQWKRADTFKSTEALQKQKNASIFILHISRPNRPAETQRNFEPSGFSNISELPKHLISPCDTSYTTCHPPCETLYNTVTDQDTTFHWSEMDVYGLGVEFFYLGLT